MVASTAVVLWARLVQVDVDEESGEGGEQAVGGGAAGGRGAVQQSIGDGGGGEGEDAGSGVLPADREDDEGEVGEELFAVGGMEDGVPGDRADQSSEGAGNHDVAAPAAQESGQRQGGEDRGERGAV